MSRIRAHLLLLAGLGLLFTTGCGRRDDAPLPEDPQRDQELRLFREGVRTVQERYVDADRVQLDMILSNSIKGMVASVDPYATIHFTGPRTEPPLPEDVPLVELEESDDRELVVLNVYGFQPLLRKHLRALESKARDRRPAGILIDARGATGMDYAAATDLAGWFLPRGSVIGSLVEKQGEATRAMATRRPPIWTTNRVVVLIDGETAGPAEWLAAALQFHHRALLVGEPSRGATVLQSPVPITDEWTVMLTTGRALNPDGRDVTGHPLTPDVIAQPDEAAEENVDWLFLRGMKELKLRVAGPAT